MTPTHSEDHLPIGARLDDYEIQEILGQGGFGITYKCWDNILSCFVALKEYFPGHIASRDSDSASIKVTAINAEAYNKGLESFVQEAQTLARFQHPGVVPVKRLIQSNNTAYMVMGFVEGASLAEYRRAQISPRQLLTWTEQLLDALEQVHEAGLLHRDIKPGNVYIDTKERAMLLDFGASRRAVAEASHSITGIVSTGYSPPEQYSESTRNQGPWSDLYSLSATLYRCITGHKPAEAPIRLDSKVDGEPDPLRLLSPQEYPQFPAGLLDAVCKGLALNKTGRPQSVAAFRRLLQSGAPEAGKIEPTEVTEATEAAATQRRAESKTEILKPTQPLKSRTGKRRPIILASLLAAVAVVGAAVGVLGWPLIQEYTRWQAVQCDDAESLRGYLAAYPDGRYEADAKTCLAAIEWRLGKCDLAQWNTDDFFKTTTADQVRDCLNFGANINMRDKGGYTPLHRAAYNNENSDVIITLINAGTNINVQNTDGETPLHAAALNNKNPDVIITLINAGANINVQNKDGYTPLHRAAKNNENPDVINTLLNAGANINVQDKNDNTPLHHAAFDNKNPDVINTLLNVGADINARNKDGNTPLHLAALNNENPDVIITLINAGANINAWSDNDVTPLHAAAWNNENPDVINTLINAGANINVQDENDNTPLHLAAENNKSPDVIITLINAGANINARNDNDATPLHFAAVNNENSDIINALINVGADINARNYSDATPLHFAAVNNKTPDIINTLLNAGANINVQDRNDNTPLHHAAFDNKNPDVINTLLNVGADINARNKDGNTPLHVAAVSDENPGIINALINVGADINARNDNDATPLHFAAVNNKTPDVINTLLNAGADINAQDKEGSTPWDLAQENDSIIGTEAYRRLAP